MVTLGSLTKLLGRCTVYEMNKHRNQLLCFILELQLRRQNADSPNTQRPAVLLAVASTGTSGGSMLVRANMMRLSVLAQWM